MQLSQGHLESNGCLQLSKGCFGFSELVSVVSQTRGAFNLMGTCTRTRGALSVQVCLQLN